MPRGRPSGPPWEAPARMAPAWARPRAVGTRGSPVVCWEWPWAARKSSVAAGPAARQRAASFAAAWPVAACPVGASAAAADRPESRAEAARDTPEAGTAAPGVAHPGMAPPADRGRRDSRVAVGSQHPTPVPGACRADLAVACRAGLAAASPAGLPAEAHTGPAAAPVATPAPGRGPAANMVAGRGRPAAADSAGYRESRGPGARPDRVAIGPGAGLCRVTG